MKTNQELAYEVLNGIWGNGETRKKRLTDAGYDFESVQSIVNSIVYSGEEYPVLPVENSVENVDNSTLKVDVDLTKYDCVELNIIW